MGHGESLLRRDVLRGAVVGGVVGIAGCAGDTRGTDGPTTGSGSGTTPNGAGDGSATDEREPQTEGDDDGGDGGRGRELAGDGQHAVGRDALADDLEIDGATELQFRPPRMSSFSLDAQFEEYSTREITGYEDDQYGSGPGRYVLDAADGTPNALTIPSRSLDGESLTSVTFDIYVGAEFAEAASPVNVGWAQISTDSFELVNQGFRSMSVDEQIAPGIARTRITVDNGTPEGAFTWQAGVGGFGEDAVSSSVPFDTDAPALFCYARM